MKNLAREYWKQELKEFIECSEDIETNDDMLEEMVDDLMCDKDMWYAIDEAFSYCIHQFKNRED